MAKRSKGVLLFGLTVALLVIISARVSPGEARESTATDPRLSEIWPITTPQPTETPEPTPEPTPNIRDYLPDAAITDWNLRLVNNTYMLPASFAPRLASVRDDMYFDNRAADALEEMLLAAEAAGHTVCIRNAYRPYSTQAYLFFGRATIISETENIEYAAAEEMARSVISYPGTSEHQTGLAVDLMDDRSTEMNEESAEKLPVLKWLREHCQEYGFIYRYPKEKQEITGWYEPWHFRYVGKDAAAYIMENQLCLEEFIALF